LIDASSCVADTVIYLGKLLCRLLGWHFNPGASLTSLFRNGSIEESLLIILYILPPPPGEGVYRSPQKIWPVLESASGFFVPFSDFTLPSK
jgi:hypothetical protein